jgi:hypothetical protein
MLQRKQAKRPTVKPPSFARLHAMAMAVPLTNKALLKWWLHSASCDFTACAPRLHALRAFRARSMKPRTYSSSTFSSLKSSDGRQGRTSERAPGILGACDHFTTRRRYSDRSDRMNTNRAATPLHAMALEYFFTCRTQLCAILLQALLNRCIVT